MKKWLTLSVLCMVLAGVCGGYASVQAQNLKVTLLGTGDPQPRFDRFGPSTLVQTETETLLFDCGRGATLRMRQLMIPLGQVTDLFLTHLHSDHVSGIVDFWLTGWSPMGNRKTPLRVWGPAGTKEMTSSLEKAFQADYRIRTQDEKLPPEGYTMIAQDIKEGTVYEKNGLRVTAFQVDHFPEEDIEPCLGYRIDYAGRSVVLSGDTRYCENLIRFSKGTDVLVHEVAAASEMVLNYPPVRMVMAHHTTPEEAGKVFTQVKPKMAVYTHLVLVSMAALPTPADLINRTRKTYSGPLEVGEDLMVIEVGDEVTVRRPPR